MNKLILGILLLTTNILAGDIVVNVVDILNTKGKLAIGLYNNDDDSFGSREKNFKGVDVEIKGNTVVYKFVDVPPGTYAVAVIHDENKNDKLDTNFLGIPNEGYGFSNNIRPMFRGANFKESKFELKNNKTITINLGY